MLGLIILRLSSQFTDLEWKDSISHTFFVTFLTLRKVFLTWTNILLPHLFRRGQITRVNRAILEKKCYCFLGYCPQEKALWLTWPWKKKAFYADVKGIMKDAVLMAIDWYGQKYPFNHESPPTRYFTISWYNPLCYYSTMLFIFFMYLFAVVV